MVNPTQPEPAPAVESSGLTIEETGHSSENKINQLIKTAADVKVALDRRTFWMMVSIAVPLIIGAVLLWQINDSTMNAERMSRDSSVVARRAYIQSLTNGRDRLIDRKEFAQTRDCPVEYFRDLIVASRAGEDVAAVPPPCEMIDTAEIDKQIAEITAKIDAAQ